MAERRVAWDADDAETPKCDRKPLFKRDLGIRLETLVRRPAQLCITDSCTCRFARSQKNRCKKKPGFCVAQRHDPEKLQELEKRVARVARARRQAHVATGRLPRTSQVTPRARLSAQSLHFTRACRFIAPAGVTSHVSCFRVENRRDYLYLNQSEELLSYGRPDQMKPRLRQQHKSVRFSYCTYNW